MASLKCVQEQLQTTDDKYIVLTSPSRAQTPPTKITSNLVGKERLNAIVDNVCYNLLKHFSGQRLLRVILDALMKLFETATMDDACDVARLTLVLHATKANWGDLSAFNLFVVQTCEMSLPESTVDQKKQLVDCATQALRHPSVWSIAWETAVSITGKQFNRQFPVEVRLVRHRDEGLYGFAGSSCIYLNVRALGAKWARLEDVGTPERRDTAFQIDIMILTMHELTHVILRMIENDLNASTPTSMARSGFSTSYTSAKESGPIAETAFFGGPAREFYTDDPELSGRGLRGFNMQWGTQLLNNLAGGKVLPKYLPEYGGYVTEECMECATMHPMHSKRKRMM